MLRIVGRRDDGYHLLQTVFQFLDIADELEFRVRSDGVIRRGSSLPSVAEADDLSIRAARLLQAHGGTHLGADVFLRKRVPMGGGLGGGSSDAATTLVALNALWGLDRPVEDLMALGLRLGADVPVFVGGQAAWAEGVGERLSPLSLERPWYLVLVPAVQVSTHEVFNDPQLTRNSPRITIREFLAGSWRNDCESVVRAHYPEVADALSWLSQYGAARLTGTGACVFVAFDQEQEARGVQQRLPLAWQSFVARGLVESPLLTRLRNEL